MYHFLSDDDIVKDFSSFNTERVYHQIGATTRAMIQFDTAFDKRCFRSTLGFVVRDQMGEFKASKTILHYNISSLVGEELNHRDLAL